MLLTCFFPYHQFYSVINEGYFVDVLVKLQQLVSEAVGPTLTVFFKPFTHHRNVTSLVCFIVITFPCGQVLWFIHIFIYRHSLFLLAA